MMELMFVLRMLRRWWWLLLLIPLVGASSVWVGLRSKAPVYEASVKLQITTPQREDVAVYDEYRYASVRDEIAVARNNFTEVLQGDDLRNQTARQLELNERQAEFPIEVTTVRDADFIYVTVEAASPTLAAQIANTLVNGAIAYYGDLRARSTFAERDLFVDKLRTAEESYRTAQERFSQFQAENGAVSLNEQLETHQRLLEQLQLERDRLLLEETTRVADPVSEVDRLIAQHQQELDRLASLVPDYSVLQEDVESARESYQNVRAAAAGAPGEEGQLNAEASAMEVLLAAEEALASFKTQHNIVLLESEMETYEDLLQQLQLERDRLLLDETTRASDAVSQVDKIIVQREVELDRLSALLPTYDLLSEELSLARDQYTYILNKYNEAELTAAAVKAANFIQVVEPAQPPTEPASNTALYLLLTILGSIGVAVMLVFLLEYVSAATDDTIPLNASHEGQTLGLPVLGMVPEMAGKRYRASSREEEAFLQLRTRLLMSCPDGQLKTLLVTSPQPRDGKTVVAANLCATMAASGARVVLVDADLRNPALHEWFDLPNRGNGLAQWLQADEDSLEDLLPRLVRATDIPGLSLITTGPLPPDPSFLLSSLRMAAVLDILSEHFDRVVLDSPPVVVAPDAIVLARLVESTLLVLNPDHGSRRMASQAINSLTSWSDIHIIGTTLNQTKLKPFGYWYYGHPRGDAPKAGERRSLFRRRKASGPVSGSPAV